MTTESLIDKLENLIKPSAQFGIDTPWKQGRIAGIAEAIAYVREHNMGGVEASRGNSPLLSSAHGPKGDNLAPLAPSEISVVDEEQLVSDIAADICDTVSRLNGLAYTPQQWMGTARKALKHFAYHTKPVSVDLEVCARAIYENGYRRKEGGFISWDEFKNISAPGHHSVKHTDSYYENAKAVLDAAQVKYE